MKTLSTILVAMLLYAELSSQWVLQKPLTYQTDITSVYFTDANNGWAAADYGLIFNTGDGGVNWSPISNQPELREKLNSVFFVNNTLGFTVGDNGTIYKITSTDAAKQVSNTAMNLFSVFFTSADVGYCTGNGGTILKTTNGGTTWVKLTTGTNYSLSSIYFTDSNTGYAVGGQNSGYMGIILKTTNAGATWKVQYSGQQNRYLYSVYFKNSTTGWVCGWNGTILKTTNGGTSWVVQPRMVTSHLRSINFTDLQKGMSAGTDGSILKTTNGGTSWVKLTSGTNLQLNAISFTGSNSVIAAGNKGTVLSSINSGTSFQPLFINNYADLKNVVFNTKDIGWILATKRSTYVDPITRRITTVNTFYKTTNGGGTWIWQRVNNSLTFTKMTFADALNGWGAADSILFKTTNGGINWQQKLKISSTNGSTASFPTIYFLDKNTGWALCKIIYSYNSGGILNIYRTSNGGNTWNKTEISSSVYWFYPGEPGHLKVYFKNKNEGWITGTGVAHYGMYQPVFYHTTDGGENWEHVGFSPSCYAEDEYLGDITFTDNLHGYIVGATDMADLSTCAESDEEWDDYPSGAAIISTTDGGENWVRKNYPIQIPSIYESSLYSISFPTISTGYAVGTGMLKTTDYGENWSMQTLPVNTVLNSVYFTDPDDGWVVGENGIILKYDKNVTPLPMNWRASLYFTWSISNSEETYSSVNFGQEQSASDGIDSQLGEEDLPPLPPMGNPDARFILPDNITTTLNDIRNSNDKYIVWNIPLQFSNDANEFYGFSMEWNGIFRILPGSIYLTDGVDGSMLNIDMKEIFHAKINEKPLYNSLKIIYSIDNLINQTSTVSYNQNWNIISVPIKATYMTKAALFPGITSDAFEFDGKYFTADVLENGKGYWIKADNAGTSLVSGIEVNLPISINKGWNLVAPFNKDVPIEKITTQPAGIIASPFYGFDVGYFNASVLSPGKGYWIKAGSDGEIIYNTGTGKANQLLADVKENWGKIIVEDNLGNSSTLYDVLDDDVNLKQYELPPLPPMGVFDARFSSGLMAERLNSEGKSIQLSSAAYPISIKAEGIDLRLSYNVKGKQVEYIIEDGNSYSIDESSVKILEVKRTAYRSIPKEFALYQNYPNPFNPKTKIKFDIPEKTNVNISIYNMLGEEIAELINKEMEAGYHEIDFNAGSLSSGIYFYRIDTDKNHSVKKMMLMK